MGNYKHLNIGRENLNNPRRTKNPPRFVKREDLRGHGQKLNAYFADAQKVAKAQIASSPNSSYVLKLRYEGALTFKNLQAHGIEFVSQEDNELCVVFATEQGLAKFADHLARLGLNDAGITHRQLLEAISGIDTWSPEDRMSWAVKNIGLPVDLVFKLDIELWPVKVANHPLRNQLCEDFERWLAKEKIVKLDRINLDSLVMYRLEVSSAQASMLLNHRDVRMVDLIPVSGISYRELNRDINELPRLIPSPSPSAARVCILDSGINTNHPLLRSSIAESASFIDGQDEFDDAGHGTAVAGIALYGDVEACNSSNFWHPAFWLFNGKIMKRCPISGDAIYDEHSLENSLAEAVRYFVDLGCRIFNLSLGNANAPYDGRHIRGLAYVLDSLTRQYNVLFVVSTGNFRGSEIPPVPFKSWREEYPDYLLCEQSRIIDPAPALNVLTVGSVARHNATLDSQKYPEIYQLSPASENQPSPFTRHGPSIKGALKPELIAAGGNLACPMRQADAQWRPEMRGLGILTLNNQVVGNTIFKEISGTSFSAPYVTHLAGRILNEYPDSSANLLRAMLVNHAAIPGEVDSCFSDEMKAQYKDGAKTKNRDIIRDVAGYGSVDESELFRSSDTVVVLMSEEYIEKDAHQFFELPLPEEFLRSARATRELKVTLAYSPAVRTTRMEYVATSINFRLVKGKSLDEVQKSFNHDNQKEEDTRNDDAVGNRNISAQLRGRGTVQSSTWTFKQRNPKEKWFVVVTRQDRDWSEAVTLDREHYALVVTVTDRDNEKAELYTQIQARIQQQERERERERQRGRV